MWILNSAKGAYGYTCSGTLYRSQPALPSYTGWTFSSGCESPTNSTGAFAQALSVCTIDDTASQRCTQVWADFPLCPRAEGTGVDWVSPCAVSSAESWAVTSYCTVFSVVILTELVWDITWQPKFACTAALWASCAYLCIPVYAKGLSLHFGKRFLFGCKGLRLELCKALKGGEKPPALLAGKGNSLWITGTASQPLALHPVLFISTVPL